MIDQIYYAYVTALFLIFVGYVAGYLVGRLDIIYSALRFLVQRTKAADEDDTPGYRPAWTQPGPRKSARKETPISVAQAPVIDINETKFVAPVNTSGMERAGSGELGKTTAVQDDIGSSVSKLAQLKGK